MKMKIRIELEDNLEEDEVIVRCSKLDANIQKIQKIISEISTNSIKLSFYKDNDECYFSLNDVLFFETNNNYMDAHTAQDVYRVKYRLYELEEILPSNFVRISKSTIMNLNHIFSINHSLTSSSLVKFYKSHKQVYVSRHYYKYVKEILSERRNYEK